MRRPWTFSSICLTLAFAIGVGALTTALWATVFGSRSGYGADRVTISYGPALRAHTYESYAYLRRNTAAVLQDVTGSQSSLTSLTWHGGRTRGSVEFVSPEYFSLTSAPITRGRAIRHEDAGTPVAVVAHAFAARAWPSADPIGQVLVVGGAPSTVIGVVDDGFGGEFGFLAPTAAWLPLEAAEVVGGGAWRLAEGSAPWIRLSARLREGVQLSVAQAQLAALARDFGAASDRRLAEGVEFHLRSAESVIAHESLDAVAWPLFVAIGVVALSAVGIACMNATAAQFMLNVDRSGEFAIRRSLGASRAQLAVAGTAETITALPVAAVLGYGVTVIAVNGVDSALSEALRVDLALSDSITRHVLGAAAASTLLVAPVVLVSSWRALRVSDDWHTIARHGMGSTRPQRIHVGAIAIQLAVTTALCVAAGIAVGEVVESRALVGPDRTYAEVSVRTSGSGRSVTPGRAGVVALSDVARRAGAEGVLSELPFDCLRQPLRTSDRGLGEACVIEVTGDALLGMLRLLDGHASLEAGAVPAPVVMNTTARDMLGLSVGRIVSVQTPRGTVVTDAQVVGTVDDSAFAAEVVPRVYRAMDLGARDRGVLTTAGSGRAAMQRALADLERDLWPAVEVHAFGTSAEFARASQPMQLAAAAIMTWIAAATCLLAVVGLYGAFGLMVRSRLKEWAVRIAVGAEPGQLRRRILARAGLLAFLSASAGLMLTAITLQVVRVTLGAFETPPPTLALSIAGLICLTSAGVVFASTRAIRAVDPATLLRMP